MTKQNLLTEYEVEVPITISVTLSAWIKGIKALSKHEVLEVVTKISNKRLLSLLIEQLNQGEDSSIDYSKLIIDALKENKSEVRTINIENVYEANQIDVDDERSSSCHQEEE